MWIVPSSMRSSYAQESGCSVQILKGRNMQYEIINSSDPYTFVAQSREVAALTIFLLGTQYAAEPETGEEGVPLFIFGGAEDWYLETFMRTPEEAFDTLLKEVIESLDSVMLGEFTDRKRYDLALNAIDCPEKKKQFKEAWQESRSSTNDIGSYAHVMAAKLKSREVKCDVHSLVDRDAEQRANEAVKYQTWGK